MQRVPSARHRGSVLALAVALASGTAPFDSAHAQQAPAPVRYDTSLFKGLQWRNVGPNRGGRSTAVAGSAARPNEYYFGATGGGLWKSTDGGNTWKPVTDGKIGSSSVGAVGVCESNPDVVYVGMGETELRGNIMQGDGVYKTTDAGKTWQHVGLENTQAIAKIRVLPGGCDNVVAAVLGHPYGKSAERGVYKSTDGGKSWKKTLYRNDGTGAIDVVVDPKNPQVMYASLWDAFRTSWMLSSGGPGSGIFKSTDGGESWKELTRNPGLPKGTVGKIGLSVSGADPSRVYAMLEAEDGGLFRSDDAGATWTKVNDERKLRQRAFYYSRVYADPKDKDVVYVLNVQFWKSTDGGKTFPKQLRPPHGDNHDLWIASNDPQRMIEANDGGGTVSVNGGETWTEEDYPTAQLYHIAIDNRKPYFVCGAQQDNSTVCMPSKGWGFLSANGRAPGDYFYAVGGGESGYIANSPAAPDIYYAGSYGGLLTAYDHSNGQERAVNPWPDNPMGYSSGDIAERFQWTFPIVVDPLDPKTVYAGSQHLMRSTNGGQSWETISPDLTRHDPKTLGASGGPITKDQTGVETYATIFSIAPSPVKAGIIWTGSDDGFVQVTQDGGKTWANVTPKDLPPFARIQMVEASPRQPGRAYVAASRYQSDDLGLYAYRTDDFGKTWTKITNGIRPGDFVRVVREDPGKEGLLYAGTEHGIYLSFDDGASWQPFGLNLPDAQVPDILTHEGDIVIATHGRSAYILDGGAAFLRQLAPVVAQHDVHLFKPTDATRSLDRNVAILYNLKQPAKELTVDILDAQGNVVRSFKHTPEKKDSTAAAGGDDDEGFRGPPQPKSPPNKAGLNRFTWDLRYPGPVTFPKLIMWAAGTNGPKAPVGTYQVRLTADGNAQTQSFAIGLDPRVEGVTPADIKAQFDFAVKIRDRASEANEAVIAIRDVKDQVADRLKKSSDAGVKKLADAFTGKISGIEQEIYQVRNQSNQDPLNFPIKLNNKIAALQGVVESADARPTDQSLTVFNQLSAKLQVQLDALKAAFETDLPRLNKALQGKGLDPVAPPSPEKIRTIAEGARDQ